MAKNPPLKILLSGSNWHNNLIRAYLQLNNTK